MYPDLLYQIALTHVPNIGDVRAKMLIEKFGDAHAVFSAPLHRLEKTESIGILAARSIKKYTDFSLCESEIAFIEKNRIRPLFMNDPAYPQRLLNCYDSPPLLYYKGNADLNATKIISVVGTRNHSDYGKKICERFIEDLAAQEIIVVSGLAFGIDSIAHRASLKHNLKTVGVMAHGLDKIYPAQNKKLAEEMIRQGGLLTDFMSGTNPDRQNFPSRNRIVAGICEALVVIETKKSKVVYREFWPNVKPVLFRD